MQHMLYITDRVHHPSCCTYFYRRFVQKKRRSKTKQNKKQHRPHPLTPPTLRKEEKPAAAGRTPLLRPRRWTLCETRRHTHSFISRPPLRPPRLFIQLHWKLEDLEASSSSSSSAAVCSFAPVPPPQWPQKPQKSFGILTQKAEKKTICQRCKVC